MAQVLTVVALSKSEKSALCSLSTPIEGTPFVSADGSGNLLLDAGQPVPAVGTQFPVPEGFHIEAEERITEDGKSFVWFTFARG